MVAVAASDLWTTGTARHFDSDHPVFFVGSKFFPLYTFPLITFRFLEVQPRGEIHMCVWNCLHPPLIATGCAQRDAPLEEPSSLQCPQAGDSGDIHGEKPPAVMPVWA